MIIPFDPRARLGKYGVLTVSDLGAKQAVFLQGDAADSIYYIQKRQIQPTVVSMEGKEAVIAAWYERFLRRGLLGRRTATHGDCHDHDAMRCRAAGKANGHPCHP